MLFGKTLTFFVKGDGEFISEDFDCENEYMKSLINNIMLASGINVGKYLVDKPKYKKAIVTLAEGDTINLFVEFLQNRNYENIMRSILFCLLSF